MLQNKRVAPSKECVFGGRPAPKRQALVVAASGRWTLGGWFDAIRGATSKQKAALEPVPKTTVAQDVVESEPVRLALPPTFQRLSPELVVLLDPKHERLVYLLSVDEASGADVIAGQLRNLLRTAAAPYVHLMALSTDLRTALRRKLPGGRPVVSTVPMPRELAAALQQQQEQVLHEPQEQRGAGGLPHGLVLGAPGEEDEQEQQEGVPAWARSGSRQWAPGGVLEMLYGNSELQPGGSSGDPQDVASAPGAVAAGAGAGAELDSARGGEELGWREGRDVPDVVMTRRRQMDSLMAWQKGASGRVTRRRGDRTPYRFDWMIKGFNSPDYLSVVPATPNMILIRNNVEAYLDVDILQALKERLAELTGGGSGDTGVGAGEDEGGARSAAAAAAGEVVAEGEMPEDLAELLKAIGIFDSDSDDDDDDNDDAPVVMRLVDDDDEEDESDDEEDEDGEMPAALMSALGLRRIGPGVYARAGGDDGDDEDEAAAEGEEEEEDDDDDSDGELPPELVALLERQGSFKRLPSGIFVPVDDDEDDSNGDDDDDIKTAAKMQDMQDDDGDHEEKDKDKKEVDLTPAALMSALARQQPFRQLLPDVFVVEADKRRGKDDDPDDGDDNGYRPNNDDDDDDDMWGGPNTLDVQLSPGPMGWTASLRLGRGEGGGDGEAAAAEARRKQLMESLRVDAEYLQNMGRLEALWEQQAQEEATGQPKPESQRPRQEPGQEATGRGASSPAPPAGPEGSTGVDSPSGSPSGSVSLRGSGGLEADWRQAEIRAAASAGTSGRPPLRPLPPGGEGVSAAAARGAVPTDRLMGPPRRPGSPASAASTSTSGRSDEDGEEEGEGEERTGRRASAWASAGRPPHRSGAPPSASSSAASEQDGFVASTRSRRGGAAEGPRAGIADSIATGSAGAADGGGDAAATISDEEEEEDGGHTGAGPSGLALPRRPTGRSRMVRRPRPRLRLGRETPGGRNTEAGAPEDADSSSASSETGSGSHGLASTSGAASDGANNISDNSSSTSGDGAMAIPAYRHLRQTSGAGLMGPGAPGPGADATSAGSGGSSRMPGAPWSRAGPAAPQGAGAAGAGGSSELPPEAAGYAALDLEQLAQFVLGRQASPDEVQDLARAVAQSAELEAAFGGLAGPLQPGSADQQQQRTGPLGFGGGFGAFPIHRPWRRPGTPPPTKREIAALGRGARRVVTPRRLRLRVPLQVQRLAAKLAAAKPPPPPVEPAEPPPEDEHEGRPGAIRSASDEAGPKSPGTVADTDRPDGTQRPGGRRLLSGLALRRLGRGRADTGAVAAANPAGGSAAAPAPAQAGQAPKASQQQQREDEEPQQPASQEELAEAMAGAFRSAPPLERQAAEALVAFLRGRRYQPHQTTSQQTPQQQQLDIAEALRNRTGLPGLVRGRDAVVVLPRGLLPATVGAWQEREQALMHPEYRVGRPGA